MILHIPHSSDHIPVKLRQQIILTDDELKLELLRMTDALTDELFAYPDATVVRFPISRLIVDVERFPDDSQEPMSKVGMGMIYQRTSQSELLRRPLRPEEKTQLLEYYTEHHKKLSNLIKTELEENDSALIIDCHSFPDAPLPFESDQSTPRPSLCIGTDSFHTPEKLIRQVQTNLENLGYSVCVNRPYQGTMVPMAYFQKDPRVLSIMIEINRNLYMNEKTGHKKDSFETIQHHIKNLLCAIKMSQEIDTLSLSNGYENP